MPKKQKTKDASDGRWAKSPWEMPWSAWKDIAIRTWKRTWQDNVGLVSAGVAYYGFLAIVPLLGLIVLAYGILADPRKVVDDFQMLAIVFPADVARLIAEQLLVAIKSSQETRGLGIALGLLVALYGATNGAGAVVTALNIAYSEKEKRSLLRYYLTTIVMTLIAVALAIVGLVALTVITFLGRFFPEASPLFVGLTRTAALVGLGLIAAAVAASLYRFAPSREEARWQWITPGSLFAGAAWILLTSLFGYYVARIANYSATYGSLGTVVVLLTWIYLSAYALVFGAELNSEIEHQTALDSTTGKPLPMGTRGAWAADHVADSDRTHPEEAPSMAEATPEAPTTKDSEKRKNRSS
jgi:membrane protein